LNSPSVFSAGKINRKVFALSEEIDKAQIKIHSGKSGHRSLLLLPKVGTAKGRENFPKSIKSLPTIHCSRFLKFNREFLKCLPHDDYCKRKSKSALIRISPKHGHEDEESA
jgi:hypothetical protein